MSRRHKLGRRLYRSYIIGDSDLIFLTLTIVCRLVDNLDIGHCRLAVCQCNFLE